MKVWFFGDLGAFQFSFHATATSASSMTCDIYIFRSSLVCVMFICFVDLSFYLQYFRLGFWKVVLNNPEQVRIVEQHCQMTISLSLSTMIVGVCGPSLELRSQVASI